MDSNTDFETLIKKTKQSMFVTLFLWPAFTLLTTIILMLVDKHIEWDLRTAAWLSVAFSILPLLLYIYTQTTLPNKDGYSVPSHNYKLRFILRWIEVCAVGYVSAPAWSLLMDRLVGLKSMVPQPYNWIGMAPFVFGSIIVIWASYTYMMKGKGTTVPYEPTQDLIIEGPYKLVRNPMVIGTHFLVIGLAIVIGSWIFMLLSILSVINGHLYAVEIEEREMETRFGEKYLEYKSRVPRWFPKFKDA